MGVIIQARRAMLVMLIGLAMALANSGGQDAPADADVEAIDFNGAWEAAARSMRAGQTAEDALEQASRVLEGEAPFAPAGSLLYAENWISASDAKLLQHEVISTPGWDEPADEASAAAGSRLLQLHETMPPWATTLAERLSPALDDCAPDRCEVHALEPGQRSRPIASSAAAVLALGGPATLVCDGEAGNDASMAPRSALLLQAGAAGYHLQCGGSRHLSIVFSSTKRAAAA